MRIDHGLKLEGDKLIITLPLEDGKKPGEVVVNGKIYAPEEKAQLSGEDATSVCKCPCVYREPCDYCHYDAYRGHGCPAEEGLKDE